MYESHFSLGFFINHQSNLYKLKVIHLLCVWSQTCWLLNFRLTKSSISIFYPPSILFHLLAIWFFFEFLKHLKVLFVKRKHFKNLPKWWSIGFLNTSQMFSSLYYFTNSAQIDYFLVNFLNKIERIFPFCGAQRAHLGVKWR